ncbi:oligosaccharide flippase family protein [Abyssalbus ytuae]|uniref:Oligosaccharide flippase family protein n=2 Tax=Abyssalbus ytuae TaxID=2926907 RepID=A0A9E6ZQF8_9FLAO|nr:oligosaccharide flippase family protein [Abyssalbus ytuae]
MNFILVPLHTDKLNTVSYSDNTTFYVYAAFFNVLLTYGMETSFFRMFSIKKNKEKVFSTVLLSLTVTTLLFFVVAWGFNNSLAQTVELKLEYFNYLLGVLVLDTLVVAPFAYLRATGRPIRFASYKLLNITVYFLLNLFFLWAIPKFNIDFKFYNNNDKVQYIFIANLAASAVTFIFLIPYLFKTKLNFDIKIFKELINYGWPIMVAGLAFVVNENLDKLMLKDMLDKDIMGAYSGCYKLAVFMTLFIQAFRLGAEPFFFNHAKEKNAKTVYAVILKYFVIVAAFGFLFIVVYIDIFKEQFIRNASYWKALEIVPVILLANLCLGIYHNLSIWYKLTDKTRYGMYISLFGAFITILFNYFMIPVIGFMASAWATLIAYGGMMIISYVLGKKHYNVPYEISKITFYLLISILSVYFSFYLFRGNYLIGTGLLLLFLGIVYIFEKKELQKLFVKK